MYSSIEQRRLQILAEMEEHKDRLMKEMSGVDKETLKRLRNLVADYYNSRSNLALCYEGLKTKSIETLNEYSHDLEKLNSKFLNAIDTIVMSRDIGSKVSKLVDEEVAEHIDNITQSIGDGEGVVMSQKATTDSLKLLNDEILANSNFVDNCLIDYKIGENVYTAFGYEDFTESSSAHRSARFEVENGATYRIKINGIHNRFQIGFTNTTEVGTEIFERKNYNSFQSVCEITNNGGYKYCYVYFHNGLNEAVSPETHVMYSMIEKPSNIEPTYLECSFSSTDKIYAESKCLVVKIPIQNKKYRIKISGGNRFTVGFSNIEYDRDGQQTYNVTNMRNFTLTVDVFTFDNTKHCYKYCYVYLSTNTDTHPAEIVEIREIITPFINNNLNDTTLFVVDTPNSDGFNGNMTADEIVSTLIEPLRNAHPNYITRTNIGRDSSDNYDMWMYAFTPPSYEQTIWIQSGVHNREKAAVFGLCEFLKYLVDGVNLTSEMQYLKHNCRLIVVPIVNPWGISQLNPTNDNNVNGVNLNRDLYNEQKQAETINVLNCFEEYKEVISFAIDCHTTVNSSYGDYSTVFSNLNQPNIDTMKSVVSYLADKNVVGRSPDLHYFGVQESATKYVDYWWNECSIPCCITEHADYVWDSESKYSSICITRSFELICMMVVNHAIKKFKTHSRVNKYL